jgi:undecaprenyl-diphosphatase
VSAVRRHRNKLLIAAVVVVVAVLYETGVIPHLPDAKKVIEDVAVALGPWTYALVGALAFLETGAFVGFVAPGETAVMVGGVVAGQGEISLIPLIGLVWACSALGDTTSFFIGRRLGRQFLLRHGPKFKVTEERLEQVESFFERHGGKAIFAGRFIGFVRPVAPFVAGSSGFPYRRFVPFSVIGCGLWSTLFCVLGYIFWRSFDRLASIAGKATLALGIVAGVIALVVFAYRRLREPEERRRLDAWLEGKPLLRPFYRAARAAWGITIGPVVRVVRPRLHYVWDRLTPGELGLEFTTTMAIAGVGLYVFALYTQVIADGTRLTPADQSLLDMAHRLYSPGVADAVELATNLGALPTVGALLLVACIVLLSTGHRTEMGALLTGAVLLWIGVQVTKAGVDRSRPPSALVDSSGSSFPSGHAAYSTVWVAVAVVLARAAPGLGSRSALVGGGVAICAVVGLSRIYLRVHYWSDVAAGWALGAAALGGCATVALVVAYIRNNGSEPGPRSQAT